MNHCASKMEAVLLKQVVFLDRDGVINQDSPDYIKRWEDFIFLPNSLEALKILTRKGYTLIVITNQSIIHRQWVLPEVLEEMHRRLKSTVASHGGRITDIFICPHTPEQGCSCRKPKPGLIQQACQKYAIDLSDAIMVGDSAKDILCGKAAGCGRTILVRTANDPTGGIMAQDALALDNVYPTAVVADLLEAARWIIS
jgi:D-glycero-D-manno-heptose 1,7-bisphosphate phosphatase